MSIGNRIKTATQQMLLSMLFVALVSSMGCGIAREKRINSDQQNSKKKTVDQTVLTKLLAGSYKQTWQMDDGRVVSFTISVPPTQSDENASPLVLSLHYGADRFTQFFGQQMMDLLIQPTTLDLNPIIIAPDIVNKSWVSLRCEESVIALVNEVCETYNVDRKRILVIGFSLGAEGAWHYAGKYPDIFTAAIPIAGRPPTDFQSFDWTVPMLAIHSRKDEVFPFHVVEEAIQSLEASGNHTVQLYPLESGSHYEITNFLDPLKEATAWVQQVWETDKD